MLAARLHGCPMTIGEGTPAALKSVRKTLIDPVLLLLIGQLRWEIEMDDRTVRVA